MGEAKRRKELGIPPRKKEVKFPEFDKQKVKKKVRDTIYKYPIIPFVFYVTAIIILIGGIYGVFRFYK